ncbi:MAG: TetR/AcrR family transcriptional regulator C-terminal domain-containing protein [Lachnospiraceae bacterium]|nr:TetR/AcrR family transcriptional regulator C-terminal domain-containing protein [Lachnospiraceae bacterium]MCR5768254.1 TetR/AcrR family transcriptional regulator C-terminal domain-containing protein [Lachnospiraceae bacterium]
MADRRTEYTRRVIRESVFKLHKKKALADITVKEICEDADVNRATFYRNYIDIFDLYEKIEEDLTTEALKGEEPGKNRFRIFEIIYKHKSFYRDYFEMRLSSTLLRTTVKVLMEQIKELLKKRDNAFDETHFEISFQYSYNGIVGATRDWLVKGCPMEAKEFADMVYGFVAKQYR